MTLAPFIIEAYGEAPDIAFGAAQRKAREIKVDMASKTTMVSRDHLLEGNSLLLEPLSESAIRMLQASEKETRTGGLHCIDGPVAYVSDKHGYYIFFGWAPKLGEK